MDSSSLRLLELIAWKMGEGISSSDSLCRQEAVNPLTWDMLKSRVASCTALRNQLHHHADSNTPLIATYHPAYLLRNPSDKKKAYLDLQFILKTLQSFIGDPHGSLSKHSTSAVSLTAR